MQHTLATYIAMDRRQALAKGEALPDRTQGAVLFADISGFTPLTIALAQELGPQRGAEELTQHLNRVYGALIVEAHRYRGSVISFAGDAITCWFDQDKGPKAAACALAMQQVMTDYTSLTTPRGTAIPFGIKTAVMAGTARRFVVGHPQIQMIDVLAGHYVNLHGHFQLDNLVSSYGEGNTTGSLASWPGRKSLAIAEQLDMLYDQGLAHYQIGRHPSPENPERPSHLTCAIDLFGQLETRYMLECAKAALES